MEFRLVDLNWYFNAELNGQVSLCSVSAEIWAPEKHTTFTDIWNRHKRRKEAVCYNGARCPWSEGISLPLSASHLLFLGKSVSWLTVAVNYYAPSSPLFFSSSSSVSAQSSSLIGEPSAPDPAFWLDVTVRQRDKALTGSQRSLLDTTEWGEWERRAFKSLRCRAGKSSFSAKIRRLINFAYLFLLFSWGKQRT